MSCLKSMDQTNCQTVIEQRLSASGQTYPADVWSQVDWVHGESLITCKAIIGTKVGWTPKRVQTEVCLATAQAAVSCVSEGQRVSAIQRATQPAQVYTLPRDH